MQHHPKQRDLFEAADPLPEGLVYVPAFITAGEEAALLAEIRRLPLHEAQYKSYTAKRRMMAVCGIGMPSGWRKSAETAFGPLRVVSAEGIVGFKLQALINDPRRTQDREDIKGLLRANRTTLNLEEVREYFRLFGRESLLDEILKEID